MKNNHPQGTALTNPGLSLTFEKNELPNVSSLSTD